MAATTPLTPSDPPPDPAVRPPAYSIGEFSRLSRLSVRMLRYYDTHDVLTPARVDPLTGYRSYAAGQLRDAARVRALRDIGMSVASIAELVTLADDPHAWRRALRVQRAQLAHDLDVTGARLTHVDHLLDRLGDPDLDEKEHLMSIDIARTTLPAHTVVALRDVIPRYEDEHALWERLMPALHACGARLRTEPPCGAVFHDDGYRESDVDVEVTQPVAGRVDVPAPLTCRDEPERDIVSATVHGSYEGVGPAMEAIGAYLPAHGLRFAGPMFNLYRVGPGHSPDPAQWVTEVCVPVAPAES